MAQTQEAYHSIESVMKGNLFSFSVMRTYLWHPSCYIFARFFVEDHM